MLQELKIVCDKFSTPLITIDSTFSSVGYYFLIKC